MGEFLLTSPKQSKMNPLCLPFKYKPFINDVLFHWLYPLSKFGTIIYSSLARLFLAIARPCTGLLCRLYSSVDLCFYTCLFVHGLDDFSLGSISSYTLDGYTLGLFSLLYAHFEESS